MALEQIGVLCANTPTLTVCDARGLMVREVAYHRAPKAEAIVEQITHHRYDAAGQLISSIDPKLSKQALEAGDARPQPNWGTAYSLSGRVMRSDSVDAGWRAHWYGVAGQVLQTVDTRQTHTRTEYDCLLRPVAVHEKGQDENERCVERFTYGGVADASHNKQGRLIRHDDPAGTREIQSYSLMGAVQREARRLLPELTEPDWPENAAERDKLLETQSYETHWQHNALGELLSQRDAQGNIQRFELNIAGQLQTAYIKLSDQKAEQIVAKGLIYNALGQPLREEAGNGVVTDYIYEPKTQRLSSVRTLRPTQSNRSSVLQDLHYCYDSVGNILSIEDKALRTQFFNNQRVEAVSTYTYDTLYQLVEATGREHAGAVQGSAPPSALEMGSHSAGTYVNYTRTYAYDDGGNLTTIKSEIGASPFTQNMTIAKGSNRLSAVSGLQAGDNVSHLTFDSNGNPASLSTGQTLAWDTRNQLCRVTSVHRPNAPDDEENYQYDGGGQRVRKTTRALVNGKTLTMRFAEVIYLPGLEIRRGYNVNGELSEELHVICAGAVGRAQVRIQHWAQPKRQIKEVPPQDQFRYSLGNHLGSSTFELDQTANILSYEEYYPFGGTAIWAAKSQIEAKYKVVRYSGKERDATGLYYYGFRYYAPWLGRWLNPDPAGTIDGFNLFRMIRNNPITLSDHKGLMAKRNANSAGGGSAAKKKKDLPFSQATHTRLKASFSFKNNDASYARSSKEQKRLTVLSGIDSATKLPNLKVSGDTHQAEHPIGYTVLAAGLPRKGSDIANKIENFAPAYQEVKQAHRDHVGTGSGAEAPAYRNQLAEALKNYDAGEALYINQREYRPIFDKANQAAATHGGSLSLDFRLADNSFDHMLRQTDKIVFLTTPAANPDAAALHAIDLGVMGKFDAMSGRKFAKTGKEVQYFDAKEFLERLDNPTPPSTMPSLTFKPEPWAQQWVNDTLLSFFMYDQS